QEGRRQDEDVPQWALEGPQNDGKALHLDAFPFVNCGKDTLYQLIACLCAHALSKPAGDRHPSKNAANRLYGNVGTVDQAIPKIVDQPIRIKLTTRKPT